MKIFITLITLIILLALGSTPALTDGRTLDDMRKIGEVIKNNTTISYEDGKTILTISCPENHKDCLPTTVVTHHDCPRGHDEIKPKDIRERRVWDEERDGYYPFRAPTVCVSKVVTLGKPRFSVRGDKVFVRGSVSHFRDDTALLRKAYQFYLDHKIGRTNRDSSN